MKKVLNYIILIGLFGVTLWIILNENYIGNLPALIKNTNKFYLLMSFLCLVIYWLCEAYIIYAMKRTLNIKGSYMKSLKVTMIGQYYSAITPFSTGGQPVQVYSLVSEGVPVGKATSIFINKFLIFQVVVISYSIVMLIFRFKFLMDKILLGIPFIVVGFLLNLLVLFVIFGFFLNEKLVKGHLKKLVALGHKLKIVKDTQSAEEKLNKSLSDYKNSINEMRSNKKSTIELVIISIIQLTFSLGITYFVYRAVGLKGAHFYDVIALQALHYMAVSFMPTPGTAGAAEGGFYMIFNAIFPKNIMNFALLVWRFIDYYLRLIISGSITLIDFIQKKFNRLAGDTPQ
jgi:hypothetical protein